MKGSSFDRLSNESIGFLVYLSNSCLMSEHKAKFVPALWESIKTSALTELRERHKAEHGQPRKRVDYLVPLLGPDDARAGAGMLGLTALDVAQTQCDPKGEVSEWLLALHGCLVVQVRAWRDSKPVGQLKVDRRIGSSSATV